MIDHQGDFGAQRSGFALNALERSPEDSGQAGQGSCACCEQNETTAVHCVWERLSMPELVSNDLRMHLPVKRLARVTGLGFSCCRKGNPVSPADE